MPLVEEYWSGAVKRLQAEVDIFNRLIGHAGEQGRENELSLVRVLENLIPRRLGVGSGMIIDSEDRRSKQTDIVLFDLSDQPTLLAQSTQAIFPVEVVHASVEVKTNLTAEEIKDCGRKKEALDGLTPADNFQTPLFVVLAYEADSAPDTVAKNFRALPVEQHPDLVCVLEPGLLGGRAFRAGDDFAMSLIPLHAQDQLGKKIPGKWTELDKRPVGSVTFTNGSSYPVTTVDRNKLLVGEPGRALLLFCSSLLDALASRGATPSSMIGHYLKGLAIEAYDL